MWSPSTEVAGQSSVVAKLPAREGSDARTAVFGPRGSENIILNLEVLELCSMNRTTRRMAQEELAVMEQQSCLAMLGQNQGFQQAVQKTSAKWFETQNMKPYLNHQPDVKQR